MNTENSNPLQVEDKKGAAVKFPPPLVFLLFISGGYGLQYFFPAAISSFAYLNIVGYAILSFGAIIIVVSFFTFRAAKTSIEPWKPTSNIISQGIFSYSRNPIYVAFGIITLGIGIILNSFWVSLSFIPSTVIIFFIAIKNEELYLEQKFGEEYLTYKANVRRWF